MLKLGLTGGIASGKSFIANEFERLGAQVIRSDRIGHEVLLRSGAAYSQTVEHFGSAILSPDGEINRAALAKLVFPDADALARLNSFVHPAVFARQEELFLLAPPDALIVVEAAILIESGSYRRLDRLAVAYCTEAQQLDRALRRPGAMREDVLARMARQLPLAEKLGLAEYVIDTSGTEAETLCQTQVLFATLKEELRQLCDSAPS